jgi:hypothetical protein
MGEGEVGMMRRLLLVSAPLLACGMVAAPAVAAAKSKESYCSLIRETPDGKFRYESKPGWSLLRAEAEPGVIAFDSDVKSIACLRIPLLLQPEDLETLQQGIDLSFSASSMNIIGFEMVDGKISWSVKTGSFDKGALAAVQKSVDKVQALVK